MKNYFNFSKILLIGFLFFTACEKEPLNDNPLGNRKEFYFTKIGNINFHSIVGNDNENVLNAISVSGITGGFELWSESISATNAQGDMLVVTPFIDSINLEVLAILYTLKQGTSVDYNIIVKADLYQNINNLSTITDKTIMTDLFFINLFSNNLFAKKDSMYLLYNNVINDSLNVRPRTFEVKFYVWVECCWGDPGCEPGGGAGPGPDGKGWGYWKLVDSYTFGNFGNRGYNGSFYVGPNGWFYSKSNIGGLTGSGNNSAETLNRYLTTNKILDCLGTNSENNEQLINKLKAIIGNCKTLPIGAIESLALQLSRRDQSEWKNIIYSFLNSNGFSETCLKSIYDAVNCQNNSPSECAIKMSNFQKEYGTLGMDEDEFIAFWRSAGCDNNCQEMEKCLLMKYFNLTDAQWQNYLSLKTKLLNDPTFLMDCAEGNQNDPFWKDLASFIPPKTVLDKLKEREPDAYIQYLKEAAGPIVNFDFFGIHIKTLPTGMNQNDLFENVRKRFPEPEILGMGTSCNSPMSYGELPTDKNSWISNNPESCIFHFEIPSFVDGNVIVSDFNSSCCWTFTTIFSKIQQAGTHPVSGHRQFGIYDNGAGYIFYTRAADRITKDYLAHLDKLSGGKTFKGADELWDCAFARIRDYIRSLGGEVEQEIQSEKYRPKWTDVLEKIIKNGNFNSIDCFHEKKP